MFVLAGGYRIIGTWRNHAPIGFGSNQEQEAKLFLFSIQTQSLYKYFLLSANFEVVST